VSAPTYPDGIGPGQETLGVAGRLQSAQAECSQRFDLRDADEAGLALRLRVWALTVLVDG
jgi:hypothetical protein